MSEFFDDLKEKVKSYKKTVGAKLDIGPNYSLVKDKESMGIPSDSPIMVFRNKEKNSYQFVFPDGKKFLVDSFVGNYENNPNIMCLENRYSEKVLLDISTGEHTPRLTHLGAKYAVNLDDNLLYREKSKPLELSDSPYKFIEKNRYGQLRCYHKEEGGYRLVDDESLQVIDTANSYTEAGRFYNEISKNDIKIAQKQLSRLLKNVKTVVKDEKLVMQFPDGTESMPFDKSDAECKNIETVYVAQINYGKSKIMLVDSEGNHVMMKKHLGNCFIDENNRVLKIRDKQDYCKDVWDKIDLKCILSKGCFEEWYEFCKDYDDRNMICKTRNGNYLLVNKWDGKGNSLQYSSIENLKSEDGQPIQTPSGSFTIDDVELPKYSLVSINKIDWQMFNINLPDGTVTENFNEIAVKDNILQVAITTPIDKTYSRLIDMSTGEISPKLYYKSISSPLLILKDSNEVLKRNSLNSIEAEKTDLTYVKTFCSGIRDDYQQNKFGDIECINKDNKHIILSGNTLNKKIDKEFDGEIIQDRISKKGDYDKDGLNLHDSNWALFRLQADGRTYVLDGNKEICSFDSGSVNVDFNYGNGYGDRLDENKKISKYRQKAYIANTNEKGDYTKVYVYDYKSNKIVDELEINGEIRYTLTENYTGEIFYRFINKNGKEKLLSSANKKILSPGRYINECDKQRKIYERVKNGPRDDYYLDSLTPTKSPTKEEEKAEEERIQRLFIDGLM